MYKATLKATGEKVAVKVQRPQMLETVSKDLYVMKRAVEVRFVYVCVEGCCSVMVSCGLVVCGVWMCVGFSGKAQLTYTYPT